MLISLYQNRVEIIKPITPINIPLLPPFNFHNKYKIEATSKRKAIGINEGTKMKVKTGSANPIKINIITNTTIIKNDSSITYNKILIYYTIQNIYI